MSGPYSVEKSEAEIPAADLRQHAHWIALPNGDKLKAEFQIGISNKQMLQEHISWDSGVSYSRAAFAVLSKICETLNAAHAAGSKAERKRIVEWLRERQKDDAFFIEGKWAIAALATELERAEG